MREAIEIDLYPVPIYNGEVLVDQSEYIAPPEPPPAQNTNEVK